jgi:hypothetical protein
LWNIHYTHNPKDSLTVDLASRIFNPTRKKSSENSLLLALADIGGLVVEFGFASYIRWNATSAPPVLALVRTPVRHGMAGRHPGLWAAADARSFLAQHGGRSGRDD